MPLSPGRWLVGRSPAMAQLRRKIERVAPSDVPVFIQGESGVGKELVAHALHRLSDRRGSLVAVNVCAVPEATFEAALFGHVRGAFTGAVTNSAGYLAEAGGGTLFLDELEGLPLWGQGKLLRATECKRFRPVGASRDRSSDFRLVAATNEPLDALAATGRLRPDLLYRLARVVLHVPPLRERREDIALLFAHLCERDRTPLTLSAAAERVLGAHDWPGNVRELESVVQRLWLAAEGGAVSAAEAGHAIRSGVGIGGTALEPVRVAWGGGAERGRGREREYLLALLGAADWDVRRAAREAGVHWTTVYRRLQRAAIALPNCRGTWRGPERGVREECLAEGGLAAGDLAAGGPLQRGGGAVAARCSGGGATASSAAEQEARARW